MFLLNDLVAALFLKSSSKCPCSNTFTIVRVCVCANILSVVHGIFSNEHVVNPSELICTEGPAATIAIIFDFICKRSKAAIICICYIGFPPSLCLRFLAGILSFVTWCEPGSPLFGRDLWGRQCRANHCDGDTSWKPLLEWKCAQIRVQKVADWNQCAGCHATFVPLATSLQPVRTTQTQWQLVLAHNRGARSTFCNSLQM